MDSFLYMYSPNSTLPKVNLGVTNWGGAPDMAKNSKSSWLAALESCASDIRIGFFLHWVFIHRRQVKRFFFMAARLTPNESTVFGSSSSNWRLFFTQNFETFGKIGNTHFFRPRKPKILLFCKNGSLLKYTFFHPNFRNKLGKFPQK